MICPKCKDAEVMVYDEEGLDYWCPICGYSRPSDAKIDEAFATLIDFCSLRAILGPCVPLLADIQKSVVKQRETQ